MKKLSKIGCPGIYVLDCYCDHGHSPETDPRHNWDEFPHQYTDEFGSKCRAMARKDGWLLDERNQNFLCPKCNPRSPRYIKPTK